MNKIAIFYFSGTGNTKYAMDKLCNYLTELNCDTKAYSIEKITTDSANGIIKESDITIIGYPIYGSDLPDIMHDFINKLSPVSGKKLGVIATQLLFSGDGSSVEKKKLKKLGFNIQWGYQINMLDNLAIKGIPFHPKSRYEENEPRLTKVDKKLKKIAKTITSGKKRIGDNTIFHNILGLSQRPAYRRKAKYSLKNSFSCNEELCINCQKCVKNCPTKAIEYKEGKVIFKNDNSCTICFRCYNFCPKGAIFYKGKTADLLFKGPTKEIYHELFSNSSNN